MIFQVWDRRKWVFLFGWLIVMSIGWYTNLFYAFSVGMVTAATDPLSPDLLPTDMLSFVMGHMLFWGSIGVAQWLLLHFYMQRTTWWSPWWALACAVGWTGFWWGTFAGPKAPYLELAWISGSILVSVLQWLVLRRHVNYAYWWICAGVSTIVAIVMMMWLFPQGIGGIAFMSSGVLYGYATGFMLIFLDKQTQASGR